MKIAEFRPFSLGTHTTFANESTGEACVRFSGWARLTEYTEVEFVPLPASAVVEGQIMQLDAAERELRNQFETKLNELTNERAKLLSLGHEKQS